MPTTSNAKKCQLQSRLGCPSNRKWTDIWFSCKSCIFTADSFTSWNTSYWFTATTENGKWKISKTISINNNLTYVGIALTASNRRNSSYRKGLSRLRTRPLYFITASKSSCSPAFTDGTIEFSFSWNDDSLKRPEMNFVGWRLQRSSWDQIFFHDLRFKIKGRRFRHHHKRHLFNLVVHKDFLEAVLAINIWLYHFCTKKYCSHLHMSLSTSNH